MVKVNKETAENNLKLLQKAADKLSRRDGLMRVALKDIAKEAGLTSGAVYARFPSREALLASGIKAGFDRMNKWLGEIPDAATYYREIRRVGRSADGTMICPAISHIGVARYGSPEELSAYEDGLAEMLQKMALWPDVDGEKGARRLLAGVMGTAMLESMLLGKSI
ncbi:MAG: helix-turn-helix domain-containing protein [Pseudomonadota bacterium]